MDETQIFIRKIFIIICISVACLRSSSESISICQNEYFEIQCNPDHFILIQNAKMGHLQSLDRLKRNKTKWCQKSDSYFKVKYEDCVTSVFQIVANQCTGNSSCSFNIDKSNYFLNNGVNCNLVNNKLYPMSVYIDYICVPKDLFYHPEQLEHLHNVGGYLTSIGYASQKIVNSDLFNELGNYYRLHTLPIERVFKFELNHENIVKGPFLFQLEIIENSISLNQNISSQTCQIGQPYLQDYYAFILSNNSEPIKLQLPQLSLCPSKAPMIGKVIGPIAANQMKIIVNVNFTSFGRRVLLVKFTKIVCPAIVIENASVVYDHVINTGNAVFVSAIAIITCRQGFFFSSSFKKKTNVTSKTIECKHSTGRWNQTLVSEKCVDKIQVMPSLPSVPRTELYTQVYISGTTQSTTIPPVPYTVIVVPTTNNFMKYGLPILMIALVIIVILLLWFFRREFKDKIKCWYNKIQSRNCGIPHTNDLSNVRNSIRYSFGHPFTFDDNTPMIDSFTTNTFSPNGSCRQSNQTLMTNAGSRPTIISGDFMQTSNSTSEYDLNQMQFDDELPTKVPKSSTISKMMFANRFRNSTSGRMRPKSLTRQSFTDRNSNYSDIKYSGSQIPLLMSRRAMLPPEFMESNSVMCTSDISPSTSATKSAVLLRKNPSYTPYSQSDLLSLKSKMNSTVLSPTQDTYLEPTQPSSQSCVSPRQDRTLQRDGSNHNNDDNNNNGDYMIYDHSRISSNNPDNTCQSSVIASLSDDNTNEDDRKRFSMISNHYYGIQGAEPHNNHRPLPNNPEINHHKIDSNSTESVYESIDGDNLHQSTIDRRQIALPQPPAED